MILYNGRRVKLVQKHRIGGVDQDYSISIWDRRIDAEVGEAREILCGLTRATLAAVYMS